MRIVIIGSGNVAAVLGRLIYGNNHEIVQVISRNAKHAEILAKEFNCKYADLRGIDTSAELYLVAISDGALYDLHATVQLGNKLVLHTAGSVSIDVLVNVSGNHGVLYPLQSLRKELNYKVDIPFLVDGNTVETTTLIEEFAKTISSNVVKAGDEERMKMHVAAVIVSNFTNHLYVLTESFCKQEQINFNLLKPLIKETAGRLEYISAVDAQTGPAIRNDIFTLDKHLRLLSNHPKLKYIYIKLTESIMKA